MRNELSVALSLAALLLLALDILPHQMRQTDGELEAGLTRSLTAARAALAMTPSETPALPPGNADIDTVRALFPQPETASPPPAIPDISAAPAPKLSLRGIVVVNSSPRAIFGVEDQGAAYRTVGLGDTIEGYTVGAIGEDSVTLQTTDGEIEIFQLRGTGELPRY